MRSMSKVYCDKTDCPTLTCDRNPKHVKEIRDISVASLEGTLLCIKPLNKHGADALGVPTESEEQQALFDWAKLQYGKYPELRALYHIPNEGKRSKVTGARLKREGMKDGVSDNCLPVKRGKYGSLYIELKRKKGSKVSSEQREWIELMWKVGNAAYICYGWEEAAKKIVEYLELK